MENNKMSAEENVIKFLLGESSLEGVWYGEKHPTEQGRFWWRKHLRTQTASLQKQIEEKDKELAEYKEKYTCNQHTVCNQKSEIAELKSKLSQKDEMLEEVFEALKRNLHHSKNCATVEYGGPCDKCTCTYSYDRELLNQYQNSKK